MVHGNLANDIAEKRRNYSKGDMMYIEGKLHTRQFVSKDGQNRRVTEIVADKMMLLTNPQKMQRPMTAATESETSTAADNMSDFSDINLDEVPDFDKLGNPDLPF